MTRARLAVLAALDAAAEPLSAAGVIAAIGCACDQATVYRALHYLEESGCAESFVLQCDEHGVERYFASRSAAHRHWFHCVACHRFIDLGACRIGGMIGEVERELGVRVARHTLYMTGTCPSCAGPAAPGRE
jgi:Fur family transcriptional regulator, ferric uptake regulator